MLEENCIKVHQMLILSVAERRIAKYNEGSQTEYEKTIAYQATPVVKIALRQVNCMQQNSSQSSLQIAQPSNT
jgi:hypothetical protein